MTILSSNWLVALLLSAVLIRLFYNKNKAGLKSIPGPAVAAYTRLWRVFNLFQGQAPQSAIKLHQKYGKLVRIAPNVISVGDPSMIPVIYDMKGDYTKSDFYDIWSITWQKKPQPSVFTTRDEAEHKEHKRNIANAYTLANLLKMESAVDACCQVFMSQLGKFADNHEPVDLGSWLHYYAFDVVCEFTFGTSLGFLEKGLDVDDIIKRMGSIFVYGAFCGMIPITHTLLLGNPLIPMLFPGFEASNQVLAFTLKAINTRTSIAKDGELSMEEAQVGHDMLSRWAAVNSADPLKMGSRDVVLHTSTNVFGGSDTTAITLRSIIYYLIKNPLKMQKTVQEIDHADKAGKLSNMIREEESRTQLPYMNAVIKEAMRIHPAVGLILPRHVPARGAIICGRHIPGGTIVGINSWVLHHDPEVFPDPEVFEPERWLETDSNKEQLLNMEKSFFQFGAGKRSCIGKHMTMMEMRKIIAQLLREFEISIPENKEWKCQNLWFVIQEMPHCMLRRRVHG